MLFADLPQEEVEASHLALKTHFSFHGDLIDLMNNKTPRRMRMGFHASFLVLKFVPSANIKFPKDTSKEQDF